METSAALGEGTDMHGALVIPLPGCCGWRFPGGAVLSLARKGKAAQAGKKQSAGKKYLQWKGGEAIMKKKERG